ncbi:MAG TPA: response regulator [Acidobacteriaceae bacterium]|nr:response regulator [Acidobacteriaceae bacterium]
MDQSRNRIGLIPEDARTKPLLVYLVEDEPLVACTLSEILRRSGCEVETFLSGPDLMGQPAGRAPDVVVTDFVMQPVDGLRVAAWARRTFPRARIVMITADAELLRREDGRHLPFRVMEKPLSSARLIAAVCDADEENPKPA